MGGEGGDVETAPPIVVSFQKEIKTTLEYVIREYRKYVNDPKAELPNEVMKDLLSIQRTENDGA